MPIMRCAMSPSPSNGPVRIKSSDEGASAPRRIGGRRGLLGWGASASVFLRRSRSYSIFSVGAR
eukprot:scaffold6241_cov64-Phaeocystis_antarctica.AAC.5